MIEASLGARRDGDPSLEDYVIRSFDLRVRVRVRVRVHPLSAGVMCMRG